MRAQSIIRSNLPSNHRFESDAVSSTSLLASGRAPRADTLGVIEPR